MRRGALVPAAALAALLASARAPAGPAGPAGLALPETSIASTIRARLDPDTRDVDGRETIVWTNVAGRPVDSLPLHLYLNAFAHDATTWRRTSLGFRSMFDALRERHGDDVYGWTEPTAIRVGDVPAVWSAVAPDDGNPLDRSLIEVELPAPVPPGGVVRLDVEWKGRLPIAAARTGGFDRYFMGAQWFPKVAGLRPDGSFNRRQFHGQTEFFADFADYDVTVGVPEDWTLVATGRRTGPAERAEGVAWHRFVQRAVHDFAFATGADMTVETTAHRLPDGREVELHLYLPRAVAHQAPRWREALAGSLDTMSARLVPYPYETVTCILPPADALLTVGMEYPTLFTGAPGDPLFESWPLEELRFGELTIAHEFAHQYFYGLVATNEFEDAFLDEGMTEHWANEIMIDVYGNEDGFGRLLDRPGSVTSAERRRLPDADATLPPVWSGPSFLVRGTGIGSQFYRRPSATFRTAANRFGRETLDRVFAEYVRRHAFRHPRVEDFWDVAREVGGVDLAAFLREAFTTTRMPDYRVAELAATRWTAPRGRVVLDGEPLDVDDRVAGERPLLGREGRDAASVTIEILDPGTTRDVRVLGSIVRRTVPAAADPADADATLWVSTARVEGPGWDHLPVDVVLRFADGTEFRETWDGRALYREYRVEHASPLDEVRIDPDDTIALDPDRLNDGRKRKAERALARDWGWWLGGTMQFLAETLGGWL